MFQLFSAQPVGAQPVELKLYLRCTMFGRRVTKHKMVSNIYKRAFIERFCSDMTISNKSPIIFGADLRGHNKGSNSHDCISLVDPLSPVGVELAVRVLSYFDFKTLLRASGVCSTWRLWCSRDHVTTSFVVLRIRRSS